ncbi:MAG: amino acid permease, partial [Candidatus Baltobacteraceae bacterium]
MIRGISLRGAVSLNTITMIGVGPLITIPLVLQKLPGTIALAGWGLGAVVALCDGLVWAELGSQYPGAGGTYAYLRDIFGAHGAGRMMAFLYNWQYFLSASLIISTGYIGFSQYAAYLYPPLAANAHLTQALAVTIGVASIALVYRRITAVARTGTVLAFFAIGTLLVVGAAGYWNGTPAYLFSAGAGGSIAPFSLGFLYGLGSALYITLYDYTGYAQIALVGEEVQRPHRTLPLSIVISVLAVMALYLFLQAGVLSSIPWHTLFDAHGVPTPQAQFVGSTVVERAWGAHAAVAVTLLVLVTAFASLYGNLVGAARVPFAAARDKAFLPAFARLHPRGGFPHVALLAVGAVSLAGCFFSLDLVIAALIAASILGGALPQIVALFVLRSRGVHAPFRMWLFPLPALVALAGWMLAFCSTGAIAMWLGALWLAAGVVVYLTLARSQRAWPFAVAAALSLLAFVPAPTTAAQKPAFVYAASFFYERVPRKQWAPALRAYRAMGINTIDLYTMWNWHELSDGDYDFNGRTDPQRDLRGLLRLIHDDGFALIVRPGPVIRNEWRNGGYPAWLLRRREYAMPLRDVLEGRYPATATFQNAHSDAAAAQWMGNLTHMRYAARWLQRVLAQVRPYRDDIIAVALDDDQGAYIDNDTWPGARFHRYLRFLARSVHRTLPGMPVFINTYQMKVTASAPVWAWGNWYQSDAYSIGEHDRAQIEFSTGVLQTQVAARPVMVSEFQAGWLQGADQSRPRAADPADTTLALHTFLQMGAHGVVNFPVQDTLNPAGWEAPWTNAFYSWDAALSVQLTPQPRYAATARFGALIARYGDALAQTQPAADAAIAYMTSAYDVRRLSNTQIMQIAQATLSAQEGCRAAHITCALVDLRYVPDAELAKRPVLIVPPSGTTLPYVKGVAARLAAFTRSGGRIVSRADRAHVRRPHAGGIPDAALLVSRDGRIAFLDIVNYLSRPLHTPRARVWSGSFSAVVPAQTVSPRDARLIALRARSAAVALPALPLVRPIVGSIPLRADSWVASIDGGSALASQTARLIYAPCAGGRVFVFEDRQHRDNLFTTIGALRDAWTPEFPPSPRDYIAAYTHPIAAG